MTRAILAFTLAAAVALPTAAGGGLASLRNPNTAAVLASVTPR